MKEMNECFRKDNGQNGVVKRVDMKNRIQELRITMATDRIASTSTGAFGGSLARLQTL